MDKRQSNLDQVRGIARDALGDEWAYELVLTLSLALLFRQYS